MPESVAFAPKAEYSDPGSQGTVFVNDYTEVNLREAFESGNGYLVTSNQEIINRLDAYEPVKRASLSEAENAAKPKATKAPKASDKDKS